MAFVNFARIQAKLLVLLGFNIFSEDDPCVRPKLSLCVVITFVSLLLSLSSFCIVHISSVKDSTNAFTYLLANISCLQKITLFYIHRKRFVKLIKEVKAMSIKAKDNSEDERIMQVENNKVTILTKLSTFVIAICCVLMLTIPLGKMMHLYWKYGFICYSLPLNGLYPFNWKNPFGYMLVYLYNAWIMYVGAITIVSMDSLLASISLNLCAQLRILNKRIEQLKREDTLDLEREVGNIISQHQNSLKILQEVKELYRSILFSQFLMSAMLLATAGFQVVVNLTDPQAIYFAFYLGGSLVQLFVYCYCGDRVESESAAFSTCIYLGYWYTFPPKIARSLQLSMMRSQRAYKLDGYFFEADLVTFNSIITTTMSYLTFLRTILDQRPD